MWEVFTTLWDSSDTRACILLSLFPALTFSLSFLPPFPLSPLLSLLWQLSGTVQLPLVAVTVVVAAAIRRDLWLLLPMPLSSGSASFAAAKAARDSSASAVGLLMALPRLFFSSEVGS